MLRSYRHNGTRSGSSPSQTQCTRCGSTVAPRSTNWRRACRVVTHLMCSVPCPWTETHKNLQSIVVPNLVITLSKQSFYRKLQKTLRFWRNSTIPMPETPTQNMLNLYRFFVSPRPRQGIFYQIHIQQKIATSSKPTEIGTLVHFMIRKITKAPRIIPRLQLW